jgi:DNA-binding NtrC family response regulator
MTKRTPVTLEQVTEAIGRHKGNVAAAAAELGRTPQALYKRLHENGLEIEVEGVVFRRKEAA